MRRFREKLEREAEEMERLRANPPQTLTEHAEREADSMLRRMR